MPSDQPRQTNAEFETTNWTLILEGGQGGRDRDAAGRFIGAYWSPIYAYIRRAGHDSHGAADLTQEFLARVVLQRGLLARADESRGRFRSYLLTALKHFLIDDARTRRRSGEAGVRYLPEDPSEWRAVEPRDEVEPGEAFERQWAAAVLVETMARLERACLAEGLERHWELFQQRVVDPALRAVEAPARAELGDDAQQVSNMVRTVKRKFDRIFRQVVAETVERREDVDGEMALVRKLLE